MFQEYDFKAIVKLVNINIGSNHMSRILFGEDVGNVNDGLRDAQLFCVEIMDNFFTKISYFLST